MFFPYGTDAPIYYWPFTTVAMIVVNVLVFAAMIANPGPLESLILQHGAGLHPTQWLTSNFIHGGFLHLIGNMLSLWAFGLVVEGKLGWYKTLAVFLGIGIAQCAVEQVLMLGAHEGGSFGASSIVFGFMAMSLVWAPENNMQCVGIISYHPIEFEMRVVTLVGTLLVLQIVLTFASSTAITSAGLHLMGAAVGFAVAIGMLKRKMVDCENWDLFSVRAGRHKMTREQLDQERVSSPEFQQTLDKKRHEEMESALQQIRQITAGNPSLAWKAHQRMQQTMPQWTLPDGDLASVIQAFHAQKLWADSVPAMAERLSRHPGEVAVRLKLAQILAIEAHRPAQALKVMAKIDDHSLNDRQRELLGKLRARAQQLHEEDPYEIADEDW